MPARLRSILLLLFSSWRTEAPYFPGGSSQVNVTLSASAGFVCQLTLFVASVGKPLAGVKTPKMSWPRGLRRSGTRAVGVARPPVAGAVEGASDARVASGLGAAAGAGVAAAGAVAGSAGGGAGGGPYELAGLPHPITSDDSSAMQID